MTARIVFDAVIQLRRRTNSLIDSFPPFHATAEKLLGSAHYPRRARFTAVEFVFRFIFHETGDYATTPTYNSISLFDFSSLYVSVSPSSSRSAYAPAPPQETYTLLLPLPPRWIHEVKARRGIEGSRLLPGHRASTETWLFQVQSDDRRPNASQDVSVWLTIIPRIGMVIRREILDLVIES